MSHWPRAKITPNWHHYKDNMNHQCFASRESSILSPLFVNIHHFVEPGWKGNHQLPSVFSQTKCMLPKAYLIVIMI